MLRGLVSLIIVLALVGSGVYLIIRSGGISSDSLNLEADWQAVFLANGQVFFGQITHQDDDYLTLEDIYYLQVVNLVDNSISQPEDVQTTPQQQLELIKLGNEIHGPYDRMQINRDLVLLIEDLKADSSVVKAINKARADQGQAASAPTPAPAPAPTPAEQ